MKISSVFVVAVLCFASAAEAKLWLHDGVPLGTGGYPENATIGGKNPTATTGTSGTWLSGTGVYVARGASMALDYTTVPSSLEAVAGSGTLAVCNSSTVATDRRIQPRALSSIPANTNVYFSVLMAYQAGAFDKFVDNLWAGIGLTEGDMREDATPMYVDGFFTGFQKLNTNGVTRIRLVAYAGGDAVPGSPVILHDNPQPGVTYMVAVKVVYNNDGAETVSFALNPIPGEENFDATLSANILTPNGKFQYLKLGGGYATANKNVFYDEIRAGSTFADVVGEVLQNSSFMGKAKASLTAENTFDVSMQMATHKNGAPVYLVMGTEPGVWSITNEFASTPVFQPLTITAQGTAPDTTYYYDVVAVDSAETPVFCGTEPGFETFCTGSLLFDNATATADEGTLAPARITVRRAATGLSAPLVVHYAITDGTAVAGVDYVNAHQTGTLTIPAGAETADIVITPLPNKAKFYDTTLTVSLAGGLYFTGATASCAVTIVNAPLPEGYKVWTATANSSVTNAASWTPPGVPGADDHVLLGAYSTHNMTIPATSPLTVASWTQEAEYSGEVVINTPFTSETPQLLVLGDCIIAGGTWTHAAGSTAENTKLFVEVRGDMTMAGGVINLLNKGFNAYRGPGGSTNGAAYGGESAQQDAKTYGSIFKPMRYGSSGGSVSLSGGFLQLVVRGTLTLESGSSAVFNANGNNQCSGGSIFLTVGALRGGGQITANGSSYSSKSGGGGRVAIYLTSPGAQRADFNGAVYVNGGIGSRQDDIPAAGNGSVYWQTAADADGAGTIIVSATHTDSHGDSYERRALRVPCDLPDVPEDYRNSHWIIRENGQLKLTDNVLVQSLKIDTAVANPASIPTLRLNGKTLRTRELSIGQTSCAPGTYTAADLGLHVVDGAEASGRVVVVSPATILIVR